MSPEVTESYCIALLLVAIRICGILKLLPFLGGAPMPTIPWLALSAALALVITPLTGSSVHVPTDPLPIAALASRELFIGVVVGVLCRLAFTALEMVADLARISILPNIAPDEPAGFTALYTLTGTALFFLIGGHHALIEGILATFTCAPIGELIPSLPDPGPIIGLFATATATAVLVTTPLFVVGLVSDMVVGGLSHLFLAAPAFGATTIRSIAVLTAAIVALGIGVSAILELIQKTMEKIIQCGSF
jgi:flagellar biosynthesis protein FliR